MGAGGGWNRTSDSWKDNAKGDGRDDRKIGHSGCVRSQTPVRFRLIPQIINKMKVYIAGKVSDLPVGEVFIKFSQAEYWLRQQGHETVNPIRLCSSAWTWEHCMRVLIPELMKCDAICLLPDWAESRGAIWEYHDAQMLGMKVMMFHPKRSEKDTLQPKINK